MSEWPACWCGGRPEAPVTASYRTCNACGTLVSSHAGDRQHYQWVGDDESGHYGAGYWHDHVPGDLHQPPLDERARSDMKERCLAWLERLLVSDPPPASVLELGCAHGGFVYLLSVAGYAAEGLEMSPQIVAEARARFDIVVHRGPIEQCSFDRPFDIIVAMDLLEHLVDPRGTLEVCKRHLAPGGTLVLQTPCYRGEGADWPMLLADDHLFLYTAASSNQLLSEAGWVDIEMTEALFPYDMWIRARRPDLPGSSRAACELPRTEPQAAADSRTSRSVSTRPLIRALLDLRHEGQVYAAERDAIDADRRAKEDVLQRVVAEREAADADRQAKDKVLRQVITDRDAIDVDRQAKDEVIARVAAERDAIDADRQVKEDALARVIAERDAIDLDRQAKDGVIERLIAERDAIDLDRQAKEAVIARVIAERDAIDADRQAKDAVIRRLSERPRRGTDDSTPGEGS